MTLEELLGQYVGGDLSWEEFYDKLHAGYNQWFSAVNFVRRYISYVDTKEMLDFHLTRMYHGMGLNDMVDTND